MAQRIWVDIAFVEAFARCFERGVLVRVTGDTIALSPPLIIERAQIDELVGVLGEVLAEVVSPVH